jgi:hypothetical protein
VIVPNVNWSNANCLIVPDRIVVAVAANPSAFCDRSSVAPCSLSVETSVPPLLRWLKNPFPARQRRRPHLPIARRHDLPPVRLSVGTALLTSSSPAATFTVVSVMPGPVTRGALPVTLSVWHVPVSLMLFAP